MEKFRQNMKKRIPNQLSAFIILGTIIIAVLIVIGIYFLTRYYKVLAVSGNLTEQEQANTYKYGSINDFANIEKIDNINELKQSNVSELKKEEKKEEKGIISTPPYYIKVNYGAQVVTIYGKDSKGKYTVPVKAMLCSTGVYTPTEGVYQVPAKIRWCHMIGDVYAQYCTQITGDILFHSVPYLTNGDHSSLEWWAYDQLGSRVSLGCIRLTCEDAKWIYDNCRIGTKVEFYSSSNPGPLGKPSTRKISSAPDNIKGWDPTDPAEGNPWGKYLDELKKKQKEEKKKQEEEKRKQEEKKKQEEEKRKQEEEKKKQEENQKQEELNPQEPTKPEEPETPIEPENPEQSENTVVPGKTNSIEPEENDIENKNITL